MLFLGIDIGTTNTKAVLVNEQLRVCAEGAAGYDLRFLGDGGVEQHPEEWWEAVCGTLRSFWRQGFDPDEVAAVCVSGHGCALVVVDETGRAIRPAISSLDTRCKAQTDKIRSASREWVLADNGNGVGAFDFEPKLLWLKETEPDHYAAMPTFLSPTGYINWRLTGVRALNVSDGGIGMAYNRRTGDGWSERTIRSMGLGPEKFPPLLPCASELGAVSVRAAAETGLPAGVPVLAGGEDTSSAALAMGIVRPGMAFLSMGTQAVAGVCTDRFTVRPELLGFPHVIENCQLLSGSMSTCGAGLQWFAREWCRDLLEAEAAGGKRALEAIADACGSSPPGAKGLVFLPYLSGELHPILDERAAGLLYGLRLEHTREDMGRAVMEGTAHAIRHNLYYAEQAAGAVRELRAVGGPAQSPLWCQIIADVTERPVRVVAASNGQGGAPLGNALLAASVVTGRAIGEMVDAVVRIAAEYVPDEANGEAYRKAHRLYTELYPRLKDLYG